MQEVGKYIIVIGGILIAFGLIIYFAGDKLSWFGNLPGDFKIKRENFSFYMPITSMLIISIVGSALLWLIRKFL